MNFLKYFGSLFASKESQARISMSINKVGQPVSTPANYEGFAKQGYSKNGVVFTAISKIALAAAGVEFILYSKKGKKLTEIEDHVLLTLIDRPNPLQAKAAFIESVTAFKLISGNSYIEANAGFNKNMSTPPLELWPVRPDRMKVIPDEKGYVSKYQFTGENNSTRTWDVDRVKMVSQILHWKSFNPLNDWYGMSALQAILYSIDINNSGMSWNLALLQNSATPSGVLQFKASDANPRGELTDEQYKRIKNEFEENYSGSRNAGRPLLLEGGLNYQQIALSPKEMDFLKSKEFSAQDISIALGVPAEIMGLGQKTFNNYREARLAFYEETVCPILDGLLDELNRWLVPTFGEGLVLGYDKDKIDALGLRREQLYTSLTPVKFLTINEKREAVGYEAREDGDVYDGQTPKAEEAVEGEESGTEEDESTDKPDNSDKPSDDKPREEDADDEENEDDEKAIEWKSINLLTANEKRQSWRRQNAKRNELQRSFDRELRQDFKELANKLEKVAKQLEGRDQQIVEFALIKTCDDFAPEFAKTIRKHIRFTLEDFGGMALKEGKSLGFDKETKANSRYESYMQEYIDRHTATQIKTINNTNEKQVRRIVREWVTEATEAGDSLPELSKFIHAEFEELSPGKAMRIARTEVSMASNNATREAVKSLQIPNMYKEWVTANDDRVRDGENNGPDHGAMNGAEMPIDEKFGVPPDTLMDGPGDPSAGADQVINCRCVLTYKSKNQ